MKSRLDTIPFRRLRIKPDPAVPRASEKLAVGSGQCVATQDWTIADGFLKTPRTVFDEVDFSEAAQFELYAVPRNRRRLLLTLFLAFLLLDGLVVFLLRDDALLQQELECVVIVCPCERGLREQEQGHDCTHSC